MSGVKISALPGVSAAALTDILPVVQSGVTSQENWSQVISLVQSNAANRTSTLVATDGALTVTYNNNTTGVGATLTNAGVMAALTIDGVAMAVGNRVLVKDQVSTFQNGIYTVTSIGNGATNWIMTRATDFDNAPSNEIAQGVFVVVVSGTLNAATLWIETGAGPFTIGTTPIIFTELTALVDGGGTAAYKNASDNTKATVASVSGATTLNALAVFADVAGTVKNATTTSTLGQPLIVSGNVSAGLSGTAGAIASFPTTAARGSLILQGVANVGNTNTTISNASMNQASLITIPDPASATANFTIAPNALVVDNLVKAASTSGVVADSGYPISAQLLKASAILTAANFLGMYATPVLIIAASGGTTAILIDRAYINQKVVSSNYAGGGIVGFQYGNAAHLAGALATNTEAAADFQGGVNAVFYFTGTSGNTVGALPSASIQNTGIYLSNQTGAFTTGDSLFDVVVYYRVVAVV